LRGQLRAKNGCNSSSEELSCIFGLPFVVIFDFVSGIFFRQMQMRGHLGDNYALLHENSEQQ
jgi:hypothetical protein